MKNLSFLKNKLFWKITPLILSFIIAFFGKDYLDDFFFDSLFKNVVTDNSIIINKTRDKSSATSIQTRGNQSPITNQNGRVNMIGDNNKGCIQDCFNTKQKPRELTEAMKKKLEEQLPRDKSIKIDINYLLGDAETGQLAKKIFDYLNQAGRRNVSDPSAVIPPRGYSFDAGVYYRETTRTIEIGSTP